MPSSVSSTSYQPISDPAGGARQQLDSEADPEGRPLPREKLLEPQRLLPQPRMPLVLVSVHRAAEDEHGVVRVEWARWRRVPREAPLVELVALLLHHGPE